MKKLTPNYDDGMWKGAPPESFAKAKILREKETNAEKLLWEKLKGNQLEGIKFRRQHPINLYIADFYCHKCRLIIEIDGEYHFSDDQRIKDEERTKMLEFNDLHVIRFTNEEVENNIEYVLQQIKNKIDELKNIKF